MGELGRESSETERLPQDYFEEDTLAAVERRRPELAEALSRLKPHDGKKLVGKLEKQADRTIIHPFGYYSIPILASEIQREIESHFKIEIVPASHKKFRDNPQWHAFFNAPSKTVFLRKDSYAPAKRIEAWILGVSDAPSTSEEEAIEHEIRHGLFRERTRDYVGLQSVNEGFARATFGSSIVPDLAWGLPYQGYSRPRAQEICRCYNLFRLAQKHGKDDVALVEFMEKNNWWFPPKRLILDPNKIEEEVLEYLGLETNDLFSDDFLKNWNRDLKGWRFKVWQITHQFLIERNLDFEKDWQSAIAEETKIREEWEAYEKEHGLN